MHRYPGKVTHVYEDGSMDIAYDDGEGERSVARKLVRAPLAPLHRMGLVESTHESGLVDVVFNDGGEKLMGVLPETLTEVQH